MLCFQPLGTRIRLSVFHGARYYASQKKDLDVSHSHFLAEASAKDKWKQEEQSASSHPAESRAELEGVTDTRGKLSPTSSHLFKLILPLRSLSHPSNTNKRPEDVSNTNLPPKKTPPTIFLLHPSQPLSHVSNLILASLTPATPSISFRSTSSNNQAFQWSDATDLGDFIRDAARAAEFTICISYGPESARRRLLPAANQEEARIVPVDTVKAEGKDSGITETLLSVSVPTFADRTRFLRRRLNLIAGRLQDMEDLKAKCDAEARHGARKLALGGFGMLVVYWGAVARLTFWDYGWDTMEPITYLSGLSTVVLGYLWFLYQGREVSYTSVLARSISSRREALYKTRGLDVERWQELVSERKTLRAEIGRIARDYEGDVDDDTSLDEAKYSEDSEMEGEGDSDGQMPVANDADEPAGENTENPSEESEKDDVDDGTHFEERDRITSKEETEELKGKREARKADAAGL